jgi:hypothetical protein
LTTEQHTSDGGREEDVGGRCQDRIIDQGDVAVAVGQSSIAESETGAVACSSRVGGDKNNVAILNDTDGSIRGDEKEKCFRIGAVAITAADTIATAVTIATVTIATVTIAAAVTIVPAVTTVAAVSTTGGSATMTSS